MINPERPKPRKELQYFASFQERILQENDDKDGWDGVAHSLLLSYLKDEVIELTEALINGDKNDVQKECVDVANFAMMIFDNSKGSK